MAKLVKRPTRLPWDVLALIFEEVDPSVLPVLAKVSLDFFTASSPILYRSVTIKSISQLEKLFCVRKGRQKAPHPSRIRAFLSLTQIRTLSLDLTSLQSSPEFLKIYSFRTDDSDLIARDRLQVIVNAKTKGILRRLSSVLFPLLNPSRCSFTQRSCISGLSQIPGFRMGSDGWNRLDQLQFRGILPHIYGSEGAGSILPRPLDTSPPRRQTIRLHVASLLTSAWSSLEDVLCAIVQFSSSNGVDAMQDGAFIFVAHSEEDRKEVERLIRSTEEVKEYREVFAVELETEED